MFSLRARCYLEELVRSPVIGENFTARSGLPGKRYRQLCRETVREPSFVANYDGKIEIYRRNEVPCKTLCLRYLGRQNIKRKRNLDCVLPFSYSARFLTNRSFTSPTNTALVQT